MNTPGESLNKACEELRQVAKRLGFDHVELIVKSDGRVTIRGISHDGYARHMGRGDVDPASVDPMPAKALAEMLRNWQEKPSAWKKP